LFDIDAVTVTFVIVSSTGTSGHESTEHTEEQEVSQAEQTLKERRPTSTNVDELLELMQQTRDIQRSWICDSAPTMTEVLKRYPRFLDLRDACELNVHSLLNCINHQVPFYLI